MERHIAHDCPRARQDTNCLTPKISTRLKARIHQRNGHSYRLCRMDGVTASGRQCRTRGKLRTSLCRGTCVNPLTSNPVRESRSRSACTAIVDSHSVPPF